MEMPLPTLGVMALALISACLGIALWHCGRWWHRSRRKPSAVQETLQLDGGHRVANMLQMILSILRVHEKRVRDHEEAPQEAAAALRAAQERLFTVAIVHRELHRIAKAGAADMQRLLWMVADSLTTSANLPHHVAAQVECRGLSLPSRDAIAIALIVGEWTTHRLTRLRQAGQIRLALAVENDLLVLSYDDDGPDWEAQLDDALLHGAVVVALVQQLSGTLIRAPGAGVRLRLTFPASPDSVRQAR